MSEKPHIFVRDALAFALYAYPYTEAALTGGVRTDRDTDNVRHLAIWLARRHAGKNGFSRIARVFDRDQATVRNSVTTIDKRAKLDPEHYADIEARFLAWIAAGGAKNVERRATVNGTPGALAP